MLYSLSNKKMFKKFELPPISDKDKEALHIRISEPTPPKTSPPKTSPSKPTMSKLYFPQIEEKESGQEAQPQQKPYAKGPVFPTPSQGDALPSHKEHAKGSSHLPKGHEPHRAARDSKMMPALVLPEDSKWKIVAKKARVLGKMALQKKKILNTIYGIDESTADKREVVGSSLSIDPNNRYLVYWSYLINLVTAYILFIYLYRVCILSLDYDFYYFLESAMQLLFLAQTILNFFVAYYEQDDLITDLKSIAIHYIFTFFFFDLASSIPMNLIVLSLGYEAGQETDRILRLLTTARVIRFIAGVVSYEGWKDISFFAKTGPTIIRLIKILILILYFVHFSACIFILISRVTMDTSATWIELNDNRDMPHASLYVFAMYWSIQIVVTVGYGDVILNTNSERLLALVLMYIGSAVYSFLVSNLGAVAEEAETFETNLKTKIHAFKKLAKEATLPDDLVQEAKKYIESNHKHNPRTSMNDQSFINELPFTLKAQIMFNINAKVVQSVSFLQDKDVDFILKMAPNLKSIELHPKEMVFKESEYPEDVFFLTTGVVHLKTKTGAPLYVVSQGEMFGEVEILENMPRIVSAQAQSRSSCFSIEMERFISILDAYPDIKETLLKDTQSKRKRLLDWKKRYKKGDVSSARQILLGCRGRSSAISTDDQAYRVYERSTEKFENEIPYILEKSVGKKEKMKFVERLKKNVSRQNTLSVVRNERLARRSVRVNTVLDFGQTASGVTRKFYGSVMSNGSVPSFIKEEEAEDLETQEKVKSVTKINLTEAMDEKSDSERTKSIQEVSQQEESLQDESNQEETNSKKDMEKIKEKKKEFEKEYFDKMDTLDKELQSTVGTLEICSNTMRTQEANYERLMSLIKAVEQKQKRINNKLEAYKVQKEGGYDTISDVSRSTQSKMSF